MQSYGFFGNDLIRLQWTRRLRDDTSRCTLLCFPCSTSCIRVVYLSYIAPPPSNNNTARRLRRGWRRDSCGARCEYDFFFFLFALLSLCGLHLSGHICVVPRGIRFSVGLERRVAAAETAAWEERTMRRLQAAQTVVDELEEEAVAFVHDVHRDEARRWFSHAKDPAQFDWARYHHIVAHEENNEVNAQTLDERRELLAMKVKYLERAMPLIREREQYEKEKETRRILEKARERKENAAAAKGGEQNSDGARGYVLEIFSGHFELPNLGPIGANGGGGKGGYYT